MQASFSTWISLFAIVLGSSHGAPTFAQAEFPARAVHLIAPVPPGSPPDVVARLVAEPLAERFGQPVIVENRVGGSQTIGLRLVAVAKPDGYTLGMVSLPTAVVPNLMARMPYDTRHDFVAVREVAWTSNVLVVRAHGGANSVPDLVRAAKARPGSLTFASGGNGTPAHVLAELFREKTGIEAVHVPFRGSAEGVAAVLAGDVDFMIASAGSVTPYVQAGRLSALAQTSETRLPQLAEVPTFAELGFPGITARDWQGVVAPAGTPAVVLERLSAALGDALARPATQAQLRALGMEPVHDSDPRKFGFFLDAELDRWAAVAKHSGLQAQ